MPTAVLFPDIMKSSFLRMQKDKTTDNDEQVVVLFLIEL